MNTGRSRHIGLSDDGMSVVILDQSLLPNETRYLALSSPEELYEAVLSLRVRGAPALGIFAGYAVCVLARRSREANFSTFRRMLGAQCEYLRSSRPTAVNLGAMLERMLRRVDLCEGLPRPQLLDALAAEAHAIHDEDIQICTKIAENGLGFIRNGCGILTHCNAGELAASRYGTALAPILLGRERGMDFRVYCDETRPLLQGARLTAYELCRAGVDCTLLCDNMAASLMSTGAVDACFVGCDRLARNGDAANKIGTLGVALLAKHYGIPFYVFCPSTTIDDECATGADIRIEQRDGSEISDMYFKSPMAPPEVRKYNPAFDVTPNELITAIVTERGVHRKPYSESLAAFFGGEGYGE